MDLSSSMFGSRDPPARAWLEHCRLVSHTSCKSLVPIVGVKLKEELRWGVEIRSDVGNIFGRSLVV